MITHKKSEEYTQLLKDQMDLATEKLQKLKPNYSYKKGNEEEGVTITLSKVLDKF